MATSGGIHGGGRFVGLRTLALGVVLGAALGPFVRCVPARPLGSPGNLVPHEDRPGRPPVARLLVDGRDVDAPPPESLRVPGHVGVSLWSAIGSTRLESSDGGTPDTQTDFDEVQSFGMSFFGRAGAYSAQLDLLTVDQIAESTFTFGGGTLATGANLEATDVILRLWRELKRLETTRGRFRIDIGMRATQANRTAALAGQEGAGTVQTFSPELVLSGRWIMAEDSAIHGRFSWANNAHQVRRDRALEASLFLNYHLFHTGTRWHDLQIGLRALDRSVGLADETTGRIHLFRTTHFGPEVSLACRF